MTNKLLARVYEKAKEEGRICSRCGWIITKKNWKKGHKLCAGCLDANKGVNVNCGHYKPVEENIDMTGEMI